MTRRRWIADECAGDRAALTGEHAAHLSRVLRARVGEEFDIATPQGVRHGRISSITGERVVFELGELIEEEAAREIAVLLSIFKFDRYEWAVEKLTELGVTTIIPLIAERTETHLAQAANKRAERWRRIALAAAEQSRRALPPEIAAPVALEELSMADARRIVLVEPGADAEPTPALAAVLQEHPESRAQLALAIGPEGGWSPREVESFRERSWRSASLGAQVLRAETAAISAVAIAMAVCSLKS
jgi:16S rRNA (uracil1498-N3)-methyltransferase